MKDQATGLRRLQGSRASTHEGADLRERLAPLVQGSRSASASDGERPTRPAPAPRESLTPSTSRGMRPTSGVTPAARTSSPGSYAARPAALGASASSTVSVRPSGPAPSGRAPSSPAPSSPSPSTSDVRALAERARAESIGERSRVTPSARREAIVPPGIVAARPEAPRVEPRIAAGEGAYIVAVASGKGGVGKSQVAANLAVELGRRGHRVLLVDADLGLASQDLILGVVPRGDLLELLRGGRTLEGLATPGPENVWLLPACSGRSEMANLGAVERTAIASAIRAARDAYDVIVLDTAAGIGALTTDFATLADETLLVTTEDPVAIRDAYAMTKVLALRGVGHAIAVVVNGIHGAHPARIEAQGRAVFTKLEELVRRFLSVRLFHVGTVPRDPTVLEALRAGTPLCLHAPESVGAYALARVAMRFDERARLRALQRGLTPSMRPVSRESSSGREAPGASLAPHEVGLDAARARTPGAGAPARNGTPAMDTTSTETLERRAC